MIKNKFLSIGLGSKAVNAKKMDKQDNRMNFFPGLPPQAPPNFLYLVFHASDKATLKYMRAFCGFLLRSLNAQTTKDRAQNTIIFALLSCS